MTQVAFAAPAERAEIAQFMQEAFPKARWGPEGWQRLLGGRWAGAQGRFAITARDNGTLVGVLGTVHALRQTPRGARMTANMSSWYVAKSHRGTGLGSEMLRVLFADPALTVTNVSSAVRAVPVIEKAGMQILETHRLVWHARANARPLPLAARPAEHPELTATERQVFEDHQDLGLSEYVVETPDGPCPLIVSIKRKHDAYVTHEVLHCSRAALLAKHARAIADTLLPAAGAILSVDARLAPGAQPEGRSAFDVPRYWRPGDMNPGEVDHLYSEIVLLGLKLY